MGKILLRNIFVEESRRDILIVGNKIEKITPSSSSGNDNQEIDSDTILIDGSDFAVIYGFANMHTHAAMTLLRGAREDVKLSSWLEEIWKREAELNDELVYWGTRLACLEMIKTGTTLYNDQYFFPDDAVRAASEMGLRSMHSYVFLDHGEERTARAQREECLRIYELSKNWNPLTKFEIGVHAPYTVTRENIEWATEFAREHGLKIHIHISETQSEVADSLRQHGCTPVEYLDKLNFFGPDIIAAHCVHLNEKEIEILGSKQVTVVHNVNSNLKLSSGYKFKFLELLSAGANVCIGTDGAASSNNLDLLESLKTTALLQKGWRNDPSALTIKQLLCAASESGYKACGFPNGGRIEEGALADLSLININNYAFTPNIDFLANLIYSAHSDCVDTVICDGRILMRGRKVEGEQEILDNVNRLVKKHI